MFGITRNAARTRGPGVLGALKTRLDVLRDSTGSTVEAIAATGLSIVLLGVIASGSISAMSALTTTSSNAERSQQLSSMVSKPEAISGWAAATGTPMVQSVVLASGTIIDTYLWSTVSATGTHYYASIPRASNTKNWTSCSSKAVVQTACVYASQFQATDVRFATPDQVPGLQMASLTNPIPAGTVVARSSSPVATEWRYYISAAAIGAEGAIQFKQGPVTLATIPITTTATAYFGTIVVAPNVNVEMLSTDRHVAFSKVLIYKAGP